MKKTVQETLRLAVEQLFIRLHIDLIREINSEATDLNAIAYDKENPSHVNLVDLCKKKIGYKTIASDQEIFGSILTIYRNWRERETNRGINISRA